MKIKSFDDYGPGLFGAGPIKFNCALSGMIVVFGEPKGPKRPICVSAEKVYNRRIIVKKCESVSVFS